MVKLLCIDNVSYVIYFTPCVYKLNECVYVYISYMYIKSCNVIPKTPYLFHDSTTVSMAIISAKNHGEVDFMRLLSKHTCMCPSYLISFTRSNNTVKPNIIDTFVGNVIVDRACRPCSNYTFILDLFPSFNGLERDNCKTRRESFTFGIWCVLYNIYLR